MDPRVLAAFILLDASFIVLLFGYLIGFRKQLSLIAGLDVSKVRDSDGLARWAGRGLLIIGVLDLLISLTLLATSMNPTPLIAAYLVMSLGGAAILVIGTRRYLN
jgi:hypothetical protein